mmetsp:Transcript_91439/g.217885  ORF Transcript_91439/g.217885 Transcript_91439/m.217885 type:complete len:240 (-) Transcript_91439:867-1586(-)
MFKQSESILEAGLGCCHLQRAFRHVARNFPRTGLRLPQAGTVAGQEGTSQVCLCHEPIKASCGRLLRIGHIRQARCREVLTNFGPIVRGIDTSPMLVLKLRGDKQATVGSETLQGVKGKLGLFCGTTSSSLGAIPANSCKQRCCHSALGQGSSLVCANNSRCRNVVNGGHFHHQATPLRHFHGAHPEHNHQHHRQTMGHDGNRHDNGPEQTGSQEAVGVVRRTWPSRIFILGGIRQKRC